ncbi:hypothetical protein V6N12_067677 [Hibiscus sabdariffa]|uniref:Uncharacterized protein n=1 Tax=Hibiscus sabdariffa TaxID=183260 RepID=A0ABR2B7T0_9ROSI
MSKVEDEVMASPKVAHSPTSDNLSKKLIGDGTGLSTNFLDNKGEDIEVYDDVEAMNDGFLMHGEYPGFDRPISCKIADDLVEGHS